MAFTKKKETGTWLRISKTYLVKMKSMFAENKEEMIINAGFQVKK